MLVKERKKKKTKYNYDEIRIKYETGQYSLSQLAKIYGVAKSTLSEYFKEHAVYKSEHAPNAIASLTRGFNELEMIATENKPEHIRAKIREEVLDIVSKKNPVFAKTLQALASQLLNKSFEMLERSKTPGELNNIANIMQKVNETLQVIPKTPSTQIAIQNNQNIQNNVGGDGSKQKRDIRLIVVDTKEDLEKAKKQADAPLDAEVVE